MPSKVFCRVILNRIKMAVGQKIPEEQTRFRAGRGFSGQSFALRNIVKQYIEWNTPRFFSFIESSEAFDSILRDTLSAVMRHYGLPQRSSQSLSCSMKDLSAAWFLGKAFWTCGPNRDDTGIYALSTAFSHTHRLRHENSQRRLTRK